MAFDLLASARALLMRDSSPSRGNLAAVELLVPLCHAAGLATEILPGPAASEANLLASRDQGHGPPLLLVTHLDTVDPGPREAWTATESDPWSATLDGDRIYGLGSADVKLDALCKLLALSHLRGKKLSRPVHWLGTFGEETGLRGARAFVDSGRLRPAFVACGEPSELRIVDAHKGYVVVAVEVEAPEVGPEGGAPKLFQGRAAHSSTPHLGENAVEAALAWLAGPGFGARVIGASGGTGANTVPAQCLLVLGADDGPDLAPALRNVAELRERWRQAAATLLPREDPRFDPPGVVTNFGELRAGGGKVRAVFDARLLPEHSPENLLIELAYPAEVLRSAGGLAPPPASRLVAEARATLRELNLDDAPFAKPTSTEAGVFARAGAEAIVFGPGRSTGNAHCPNEHNFVSQMQRAVEFYERLVLRLCG